MLINAPLPSHLEVKLYAADENFGYSIFFSAYYLRPDELSPKNNRQLG